MFCRAKCSLSPLNKNQNQCRPSWVLRAFLFLSDIGEWPSSPLPDTYWSAIEPKGVDGHICEGV